MKRIDVDRVSVPLSPSTTLKNIEQTHQEASSLPLSAVNCSFHCCTVGFAHCTHLMLLFASVYKAHPYTCHFHSCSSCSCSSSSSSFFFVLVLLVLVLLLVVVLLLLFLLLLTTTTTTTTTATTIIIIIIIIIEGVVPFSACR